MTDHNTRAEEAIRSLEHIEEGDPAALETITLAQVHATLALVEQQRISNLIAYAALRWENGDESIVTSRDAVMEIRRQAYEGLGIA